MLRYLLAFAKVVKWKNALVGGLRLISSCPTKGSSSAHTPGLHSIYLMRDEMLLPAARTLI